MSAVATTHYSRKLCVDESTTTDQPVATRASEHIHTHTLVFANVNWSDLKVTLRQALSKDELCSAICVQNIDVQCVLQFTLSLAFCCVLHRRMSRVIHR